MSNYKCFNLKKCQIGDYSLFVLRKKDIYRIMDWRNTQIDILRQKELLTREKQLIYFNKVIKSSFFKKNPEQILFSYLYKDECIGYGGFVHILWKEKIAEVSFLLDSKHVKNKALYKKDFTNYLKLLKKIAFENLKLNKLFTETYSFRKFHISILEKTGFNLVKILKNKIIVNGKYFDSLIHEMINEK